MRRILHAYEVPAKIVELLGDLHKGTKVAVKPGGRVGITFQVSNGVWQGCVAAPLLFNIFLEFVVKRALASMPEGAGVMVQFRKDGKQLFQM